MKTFLRSLLRMLIGFAIFFVGLAVLLGIFIAAHWYFEPSLHAHEWAKQYPGLSATPEPLADTSVAPLSGLRVDLGGYSAQFPWSEVHAQWIFPPHAIFTFKGGPGVIFHQPPVTGDVTKQSNASQKAFHEIFSEQDLSSNYALKSAQVRTTPADVKWWAPRKRNNRAAELLSFKLFDMGFSHAESVYFISMGRCVAFSLAILANQMR
jgi:hypothetical protein